MVYKNKVSLSNVPHVHHMCDTYGVYHMCDTYGVYHMCDTYGVITCVIHMVLSHV